MSYFLLNTFYIQNYEKNTLLIVQSIVENNLSIVHFVIKAPKLVQIMIATMYRVQGLKVPIVNPR